MTQLMHLYMCKTRRMSIFEVGISNNSTMILASFTSVCMAMLFIWTPTMNAVLVGLPFPGNVWPVFLVGWVAMFILCEGRKYWGRKHPDSAISKYLNW